MKKHQQFGKPAQVLVACSKKLAQNWHKLLDNRKGSYDIHRNSLKFLVGMTRFELATP